MLNVKYLKNIVLNVYLDIILMEVVVLSVLVFQAVNNVKIIKSFVHNVNLDIILT